MAKEGSDMTNPANLYDEVVAITYNYLGPAADRFVARQIRNHLQKDPTHLDPTDLTQLLDWIELAMRLISSDTQVIDNYLADLSTLIKPRQAAK